MPVDPARARSLIEAHTHGWNDEQRAALLTRLRQEATRRDIARTHHTAGALAHHCDPQTVQTPALDVIDTALEQALSTPNARVVISVPPQEGKALALDTLIATPTGWATMADLQVGDWVFDRNGDPCRVTWVSPIWTDRPCYTVHTGDGESIIADAAHEWIVRLDRRSSERIVETDLLAKPRSKNAQITGPDSLNLPEVDLPIDPWLLGVWLGDGHSAGSRITTADPEIVERIRGLGYPCRKTVGKYSYTLTPEGWRGVRGNPSPFKAALREIEVLDNKHIPDQYMRASEKQRLALLQGLIDSDGYVMPKGQVEFCATSRRLAEDVRDLVFTLGAKATINVGRATIAGRDCGPKYRVRFYRADAAYLPRKAQHCKDSSVARTRYVWAEPTGSVPTRCIEVDSPDHTFLAGRTLLPTHNSTRVSVWGTIRALVQDPDRRIVLASYSDALARTHARTARNMVRDHGSDAHDPLTGLPLPDKLGIALAEDKSAAGNWKLRGHRGGLYSCGVGGSMTGQPADMVIIDDPLKDMQAADSALERQKVIDWWEAVVQTRLAPGAPVIIVQTRWHEEDLAGHVLAQDEPLPEEGRRWRLVNIPAISEAGVPDALGRPPGVAMVSARGRTQADFERTKDAVGPRVWSALYQGAPTPSGGGLFSQEWFDRYRIPTVDAAVVRIVSIDPAETGRRDEAGLIAAAATADGRVVWTDDWSGRMQSDQWARRAILLALSTGATELLFEAYTTEQTYERVLKQAWRDIRDQARLLRTHGPDGAAAVLATSEDGPTTPADAAVLLAELDGITVPDQTDMPLRIHPGRWKGDKIARATGARQAASTGRLRIAGTLPVLEKQAVHWQQGQHSPDRMDAAVNAYNRLCELIGAETVIASPTSVAQRAAASGVGRARRGGAAALLGRTLPTSGRA